MRVLRASGEHPSDNELTVPEGAAFRAVNVVVDKPDTYSAHKGLQSSADAGYALSSFTYYRGDVIAHSQASGKLLRLSGGVWTEYAGAYYAPGDGPMSFDEAAGSLFFTTTTGVYRLDGGSGTPTLSGLPQALPGTLALGSSGVALADGNATAYRANWAINVDDGGNGRLIEGAPSPRLVVANSSGGTVDVDLTFPIPDNLPTGAYLRVFRADAVPSSIPPLDEMRQVYERAPTPDELTARTFSFTDATPDTVKGAAAYWAPNTGDGIALSNYAAPLVQRLSHYTESEFGTGVSGVQRLTLNMLGAIAVNTGLRLNRGLMQENYTASATEDFSLHQFKTFAGTSTPAQDLANTVDSLVRCINARTGGFARAFAVDADGTQPGAFVIEARDLDQTPILAFANNGEFRNWAPALPGYNAGSASRTGGVVTVSTSPRPIGLVTGQTISVILTTDSANLPTGDKTITVTSDTSFTYAESGSATASGTVTFFVNEASVESSTGTADNAYVWSKRYEPDHWPLTNLNTVGGANDTLWWMLPMDRWGFLGSDAGLYRFNGNADDGFSSPEEGAPWDSSTAFLGRRNVAALDGNGYALSKRGIVTWSEGMKPQNIDGPIQAEIREAIANYPDALARYGFMWADPTNHRIYFARPESSTATTATLVHVWNGLTGTWTRLTSTFPGLEAGINDGTAPIPTAGVGYFLPQEGGPPDRYGTLLTTRNTGAASDYQGPEGEGLACKVTYMPWSAGEPMRFKMWSRTAVYTRTGLSRIRFGYATDLLPTEQVQTYPDDHPGWPFATPVSDPIQGLAWKSVIGNEPGNSYMRGRKLSVSVAHSEPGEFFQLYGVEVKHRVYGDGQ